VRSLPPNSKKENRRSEIHDGCKVLAYPAAHFSRTTGFKTALFKFECFFVFYTLYNIIQRRWARSCTPWRYTLYRLGPFTWGVSSKCRKIAAVNSWLQRSLSCYVANKARARLFMERLKLVTPTNAPARHRGTSAALGIMIIGQHVDWSAAHDYRPLTRW